MRHLVREAKARHYVFWSQIFGFQCKLSQRWSPLLGEGEQRVVTHERWWCSGILMKFGRAKVLQGPQAGSIDCLCDIPSDVIIIISSFGRITSVRSQNSWAWTSSQGGCTSLTRHVTRLWHSWMMLKSSTSLTVIDWMCRSVRRSQISGTMAMLSICSGKSKLLEIGCFQKAS